MSVEAIDRYLGDIEAIKNYDPVKRELADANRKLGQLTQEVKSKDKRISELENLKILSDGRTLADVERAVLEAQKEEIERRANDKFLTYKQDWSEKEKPKEVYAEAVSLLSEIIGNLSIHGPRLIRIELMEAGIVQSVEKILEDETSRRMDASFHDSVEQRSDEVANLKLKTLKTEEWPRFFNARIVPRAKALAQSIRDNLRDVLAIAWNINCDSCGQQQIFRLNPKAWRDLMRNGGTFVECVNPECNDWWRRHRIVINLESIIEGYLNQSPDSDS